MYGGVCMEDGVLDVTQVDNRIKLAHRACNLIKPFLENYAQSTAEEGLILLVE